MSNTLTGLIPTVYAALDVVSRELVGMIPSVTIDAGAARAAVNQTVLVPLAPAATVVDVVPAQLPPNSGDQVIGNTPVVITKSRAAIFRWEGEETRGINTGPGFNTIKNGQIAQAFRALTNELEGDLTALYNRASRAFGTAGTTPFGGATPSLNDAADILQILKDNGAPENDLQLVVNTRSGAALRKIPNLTRANEAGGDTLLRQGILLDIFGMSIRESGQIKTPASGTGAGHLVNNGAGYPIGTTAITVDTGTGTILAGDVIGFASDTANKYVVATALTANVVTLAAPGLRVAIADNVAVTYNTIAAKNMAFHRSAIVLAARPPALPEAGDLARDQTLITDPRSGLTFELSVYPEYKRAHYELALAWGVANIKPEHSALLLG